MGLFKQKKTNKQSLNNGMNELVEQHVFTTDFRENLRNHGRLYFEQIIKENGELFKNELHATTTQIQSGIQTHLSGQLDAIMQQLNGQIKEYVATQLDKQLAHHNKTLKESQDEVLESLQVQTKTLNTQYQEMGAKLQQNIDNQNKSINESLAINSAHLDEVRKSQEAALKSINDSATALQQQYQQMSQTLQQDIINQEKIMIDVFQNNMAQVIEHYLAGAINEQYDLRAQLPAIVKQMQAQQKEIAEDMQL